MTPTTAAPGKLVQRFVVRPASGDPHAEEVSRLAAAQGLSPTSVRTAKVYLIEGALDDAAAQKLRDRLLVDPVAELADGTDRPDTIAIEVHPQPGVMDPAAGSVEQAAQILLGTPVRASTARRYEFEGVEPGAAADLVRRWLANPVVHHIHEGGYHPTALPEGHASDFRITHIPIRGLSTAELNTLSRDAHLFLDEAEMLALQDEYNTLGRDPTDIELETLAQTWSEHCVHKTLKSTIRYTPSSPGQKPGDDLASDVLDWTDRPGHTLHPDGSVTIDNLLKSTVAAATHELIAEGLDWTLSVFVDNAGIVAFDDEHAVCVKVETHNHPSAIEPYGGAATGIGGCIRDIIGTGLAAKPIANTDIFCVATPDTTTVPDGCLHPKHILQEVVAGVRDYGNRMGIPTLNGAVWFDDRHIGNPLVFAGSIGLIPNHLTHGDAQPGDLIVALGGRTGRDGIHGATFSSAELTDTHADEFSHAVQIGNAIEEKRVLDAILRARDFVPQVSGNSDRASGSDSERPIPDARCLYSAITDCGAGGFSSAVGEMGEKVGAEVHLDRAPLKYAGLTYTEIWISEAQERMVLAVPPANLDALQRICDEEHVELAVLGEFGRSGDHGPELILNYQGTEVGRMPMPFLHDGIPTPTRQATWSPRVTTTEPSPTKPVPPSPVPPSTTEALLKLLAHPNIASKHWIVRQYDHEVQGRTVLKPLVGPGGRGPGDAAVIEPKPGVRGGVGLAIGCGLATGLEDDPYLMALAAIDECVRNLVCVGADPDRIAILDNFCWPSCNKPENLGSLVRAAEGCYDAAKAYRTPFVSGKDSLNNQFTTKDGTTIEIPPTLLITGIGRVSDISKCVTMDLKPIPGSHLVHIEALDLKTMEEAVEHFGRIGSSHFRRLFGVPEDHTDEIPRWQLGAAANLARAIATEVASGRVLAAHDISDGGMLCAIAEMLIAGSNHEQPVSIDLLYGLGEAYNARGYGYWFGERPGGYVLQCRNPTETLGRINEATSGRGGGNILGPVRLDGAGELWLRGDQTGETTIPVEDLASAWLSPLDW